MNESMMDMMREYPQTPEEKEVREWLKKNRKTFTDDNWNCIEIAALAIDLYFDPIAVNSVLSHGDYAIEGRRFENRAAAQFFCLEVAIEKISELNNKGRITLEDSWGAYVAYVTEGNEFGEAA